MDRRHGFVIAAIGTALALAGCDRGPSDTASYTPSDATSDTPSDVEGGASNGDHNGALRQADTLVFQRRYDEAIELASGVLAQDPSWPGANGVLGRAYAGKDDLRNAATHLERERQLSPSDDRVLEDLAGVKVRLGERDGAMVLYSEYLEREPQNQPARLALGQLLLGADRIDEAAPLIEAAVERPSAAAFTALGLLRRAQGRDAEAEEALRKAIEIDSLDAGALLALGQLLVATGREIEGSAVLAHQADVTAALDELSFHTRASGMVGASAGNFVLLGQAQLAAGQLQAAADSFGAVAKNDPQAFEAALGLAEMLVLSNEVDAASQWVVHAMRVVPENGRAHRVMAMVRILSDQDDLAQAAIERSLRAGEWGAEDFRLIGRAYLLADRPQDAIAAFDSALEFSPDDPELIVLVGVARLPDDPEGAAAAFERARELRPYASGPALGHGVALHVLGDVEAGDAAFIDALQRRVPGGAIVLGEETVQHWLRARPELNAPLTRYNDLEVSGAASGG